jgi:hypothetical protein
MLMVGRARVIKTGFSESWNQQSPRCEGFVDLFASGLPEIFGDSHGDNPHAMRTIHFCFSLLSFLRASCSNSL